MADQRLAPRLIEVALPIAEISAESIRQKKSQRGHISTLHPWWARRPLAAARAVTFTSIVPDPDHSSCPSIFRATVLRLLKEEVPDKLRGYHRGRVYHLDPDPYKPLDGIPDTLRNRLLTFIAKWSPEWIAFNQGKSRREPPPANTLDDRSLIRWETGDPENEQGRAVLQIARELIRAAHGKSDPVVLDPFAGGGSLPLEASRLGCDAIANDYNPVAYLVLKATCEYPPQFGKPGSKPSASHLSGEVYNPNQLLDDIEQWSSWLIAAAKDRIGKFYEVRHGKRPVVGYIWARTVPCVNPSCRGTIPVIRNLLLSNKPKKKVALRMTVDKAAKSVAFDILHGKEITREAGTKRDRGPVICPFCEQSTSEEELRQAGRQGVIGERLVAVITEEGNGKVYRPALESDVTLFEEARKLSEKVQRPREPIPENQWNVKTWLYGLNTWGSLCNPRQALAIDTLIALLQDAVTSMRRSGIQDERLKALCLYLALLNPSGG